MMEGRQARIVTDSGSDLTGEIGAALESTVVPLVVLFGDQAIKELGFTPDAFRALPRAITSPRALPSPALAPFTTCFSASSSRATTSSV